MLIYSVARRSREVDRGKRLWTRVLLAMLAAVLVSPPARACYSGLVIIPTTDVTGDWMWAVDIQWQGTSRLFKTDAFVLNTEVGMGERFEMGLDFDLSDGAEDRTLFNAKYVFLKSAKGRFSAALGVQNTTNDFRSSPYLVTTTDWGPLRTHLGLQRTPGEDRTDPILGVDRIVNGKWQFMADYTRGDGNFASVGVGYTFQSWQIVAGAQWPNGDGKPVVVVHVIFWGPLSRKGG
jgi:hypothetical protein